MKVKELIKELQKYNENKEVILDLTATEYGRARLMVEYDILMEEEN